MSLLSDLYQNQSGTGIDQMGPQGPSGSLLTQLYANGTPSAPSSGNPITNFFGGIWQGTKQDLPKQIGQAMQFAGMEETGKRLAEWADEGEPPPEADESVFRQAGRMIPVSLGPSLAGSALGLITGGPAGAALGFLGGVVAPAAMQGMATAQETKETAEKAGVEPGAAPYLTGGTEAIMEGVGNAVLGRLLGPLAPVAKLAEGGIKKALIPTAKNFLKEMVKVQLPTEIGTEMAQNYIEASVEKGYGIRPDADPWAEAKSAIAPTAIMTMAIGPAARGIKKLHSNHLANVLADPEANPADRAKIAANMKDMMVNEYKDQETADLWGAFAMDRISKGLPIDVDNMLLDKDSLQIQKAIDESAKDLGMEKDMAAPAAKKPEEAAPVTAPVTQPLTPIEEADAEGAAKRAAAAPAQSPENLTDLLGGAGKAMTDHLYEGLFKALQEGKDVFAGIKDPILVKARPAFDQGLIKSADDLRAWVNNPPSAPAAPAPAKTEATKKAFTAYETFMEKMNQKYGIVPNGNDSAINHMTRDELLEAQRLTGEYKEAAKTVNPTKEPATTLFPEEKPRQTVEETIKMVDDYVESVKREVAADLEIAKTEEAARNKRFDVLNTNPVTAATNLGQQAAQNFADTTRLQTLASSGMLAVTKEGAKGTTPSAGTTEATRTPPPSFATLRPMPLSPTDTVAKAKARLSDPNMAYTSAEIQQRKDLANYEKDSKPSMAMPIKEEARYLYRKIKAMIDASLRMTERDKEGAHRELEAMLEWYGKSYPSKIGFTMLRNELRDVAHGGVYDLATHGQQHEADMANYTKEENAKLRRKLPFAFRSLTAIPAKTEVRFSQPVEEQIDKWIKVKRMGDKPVTEPEVDAMARGTQVPKDQLMAYLSHRDVAVKDYDTTFGEEYDAKHPEPKPAEYGRMGELRPLYGWLVKNFTGKDENGVPRPKFSQASLERAFGGMESVHGLNLQWMSGGNVDFVQAVTEQGKDNPFNGLVDPEDSDAGQVAAQLLENEKEKAHSNETYTAEKKQWTELRDQYIADRKAEMGATEETTARGKEFTEEPKTFNEVAEEKGTTEALDALLGKFKNQTEAQQAVGMMNEDETDYLPDGTPVSIDTMIQALEVARKEKYWETRSPEARAVLEMATEGDKKFPGLYAEVLKSVTIGTPPADIFNTLQAMGISSKQADLAAKFQGDMFPGTKKTAAPKGTPSALKNNRIATTQGDMFPGTKKEPSKGVPAIMKQETVVARKQGGLFTGEEGVAFYKEQAHKAYVRKVERDSIINHQKERQLMATINRMDQINDRMKQIETKMIDGQTTTRSDDAFWEANAVFWYQNQGVQSVEELEQIQRDHMAAAEEDADSFWLGREVASKKQRVFRPDPQMLVDIAREYGSAEQFEAEWNTTKIGFGVMDKYHGEAILPIPMVKELRYLRETMAKYDITIDAVSKHGSEAFKAEPNPAKRAKEAFVFQLTLKNYMRLMQAYFSFPEESFDYKGFWHDAVEKKQKYQPELGPDVMGNLNHYFATPTWAYPGTLFTPGQAIAERKKAHNVMTADEFILKYRAQVWNKELDNLLDLMHIEEHMMREIAAAKEDIRASTLESKIGNQKLLFDLSAIMGSTDKAPSGKTYVTFKYITNPRAFGVNMNPSITVLDPITKSDVPYDPKIHEIVNLDEFDEAQKYQKMNPDAELVMSKTQQALSGINQNVSNLKEFADKVIEDKPLDPTVSFTNGKPVRVGVTVPYKLERLLTRWQEMLGIKTNLLIIGDSELDTDGFQSRYNMTDDDYVDLVERRDKKNYHGQMVRGYDNKEHTMLLTDDTVRRLETDDPFGFEILCHEFGHHIYNSLTADIDPILALEMRAEWIERNNTMGKGKLKDWTEKNWTFRAEELNRIDVHGTTRESDVRQDLLTFGEYMADQVALYLQTKKKPVSAIERFFAKVAAKIREFFTMIASETRAKPELAKTVEEWLDKHIAYIEAQAAKETLGPLFNPEFQGKRDLNYVEPPRRGQGRLFSELSWKADHKGESIELAAKEVKEPIQALERVLSKGEEGIVGQSFLEKINPIKILKDAYHKYLFQPTHDLSLLEENVSLPNWMAQTFPVIGRARDIQLQRDENRSKLIHSLLKMSNDFMRLKKGESLTKVEKAISTGDVELAQRVLDLEDEAAQLKKDAKTLPDDSPEYAAKIQEANEKTQMAKELVKAGAYSDVELSRRFKMGPVEIRAYRQVRTTLDTIHERWLKQAEARLLEKHKGKAWYGLFSVLFDREATTAEMQEAQQKLGNLYNTWRNTLRAAATPLKTLLQTPEDLEKVSLRSSEIITKAMNDAMAGTKMTREKVEKIITKAIARAERQENLNAKEMTQEKKDRLVRAYTKKYNETAKTVNEMRDVLKRALDITNPNFPDENLNKLLRELIIAYGRTKPEMQKLSKIRNDLGKWVAFFPRERDDKKRHVLNVYKNIRNDEGKIVGKEKLWMSYYDVEMIGGKKTKAVVEEMLKSRFTPAEMKEIVVETAPNIRQPDSSFFKVSDMNTQRIIDNAINAAWKGTLNERLGDEVRQLLLQNVADELNARGFGRHRMRRLREFDQEGKIRTILGYKETGLQSVLLNYITSYAGMETKQQAAVEFTNLLKDIPKETPRLKDYVHKYTQEQLRNQERIDRTNGTARSILFAYYLGTSLKAPLIQLTQNYVTAIPFLAQTMRKVNSKLKKKTGFMEAERSYHKAMKDIATGKLNAKEKEFIQDLIDRGTAMDQYTQEITGQVTKSASGQLNRVIRATSFLFSKAEIFNRKAAGLAMYRFLTSTKQYSEEAMRKESREYIYRTHYLMGKANLPSAMMGSDFTPQAMRALYTFRSFTHNYILSMMPQYGGDMRTAMHSLAYLALLGGLISMPFLKDLFDWWEKQFGEDLLGDVKKELRKYGGPTLEKFGIYGLAGLMVGDISGSLSIGIPFLGEPTDTMYGVWGGVAGKVKKAGEAMGRGDTYRAVENISPLAMENVMKALRMSEFGKEYVGLEGIATTTKGRPLFDEMGNPMHLTQNQAFAKMFGFNPTDYSKAMEENRTVNNIEEYFQEQHRNLAERYRVAAMRHDQSAMAKVFNDIKEYNKERLDKHAELIVPFLKLGNVIKSANMLPLKSERKEALWKRSQYYTE